MSSLMMLLEWLIFYMVLIKLVTKLGTISGLTVMLMVLALICLVFISHASPTPIYTLSLHDALPISRLDPIGDPGRLIRIVAVHVRAQPEAGVDRKSTRLNSSHRTISYAVFCLKKKNIYNVFTDDASGVVNILHGIDKARDETWYNFWINSNAHGIGSNLSCFYQSCLTHSHLHSFPTRRSSDLPPRSDRRPGPPDPDRCCTRTSPARSWCRSEEHTSELQSPYDLVCRLLLEKKKYL